MLKCSQVADDGPHGQPTVVRCGKGDATARANREAARKNPDTKEIIMPEMAAGKENYMPQYAILRFAKMKGVSGALESHHERTKEKYASNPDIDTAKSKNNFHIVKPATSYKRESDGRIGMAGCKTRKDSVRFVDTMITASPGFFKGKKQAEVKAFFERATEFMSSKVGKDNIFTAVVHMDEKTPHMHLCFTPITEDGRLTAKEVIGDRNRLTQWQDDYFAYMVKIR